MIHIKGMNKGTAELAREKNQNLNNAFIQNIKCKKLRSIGHYLSDRLLNKRR